MKFTRILIAVLGLLIAVVNVAVLAQGEPLTEYAKPELLVDTAWVLENLEAENVVFVHLAANADAYAAGHIPGARFVTLAQLNNPDDPITGQIGTPEQVAATLSALGIEPDDTIILYDDNRNLQAARAYWVLKYYQHADVRIYNGGTSIWQVDGQSLVSSPPEFAATNYPVPEADPEIRTTGEYVLEHLNDENVQLCDARSASEYIGTDVRADRGGHIPGAINLDWTSAVTADGTFLPASELDTLFQRAGFDRDKEIITYCQTGVRGAHTWFVLRELLGYPSVRNYDGSWAEWGNNPELPIQS